MKKSNQSLDEHEIRLLQRDLNFTVTPDSISLTSSGGRRVCLLVCKNRGEADIIRYKCVLLLKNSKPPNSNISAEERRTMKTLKLDKDIMSLSLKKGRVVVLMDKSEYKEKARQLLNVEKNLQEREERSH